MISPSVAGTRIFQGNCVKAVAIGKNNANSVIYYSGACLMRPGKSYYKHVSFYGR